MNCDRGPLVSVVVPAFNAAKTLPATLHSISQQTYPALEVVVIDDGSTDETADIARHHASQDPRFRVLSKPNGGVASARNEGIRVTKGEFIAFIDSDDLWHPTKIARQVEALLAGGTDMALVYSPFRLIDSAGSVVASQQKFGVSGWVLHRHYYVNIVGNGSSILIRRRVLEELGGFDPSLRDRGAEGCEDLLLQLRIAYRYQFGEVPEYLVGYRKLPGNMSSNKEQMTRSGIIAVNMALSESRHIPGLSASAMLRRYEWVRMKLSLRNGRPREAIQTITRQLADDPIFVAGALWGDCLTHTISIARTYTGKIWTLLGGSPSDDGSRPHFYDIDPRSGIETTARGSRAHSLRRLASLDQAYRPSAKSHSAMRSSATIKLDSASSNSFASRELNCTSSYREG